MQPVAGASKTLRCDVLRFVWLHVAGKLTRIFSDVHYGERASRVRHLAQLRPLLGDIDELVLNGDTMDTRVGPNPRHTEACRHEVMEFARASAAPVRFLTGNHDPDFSDQHWLELAGGEVLVIHGDILFDTIVPWGRDAREIAAKIVSRTGPQGRLDFGHMTLETRMAIWREVAVSIPQRHQSERHPLKYALHFVVDTVWPPLRILRVLRAWESEAALAAALVRQLRPEVRYVLLGHTHRPAIRRVPGGPTIINTGSFTAPFGGCAVDMLPGCLRVRRIDMRGGDFTPGAIIDEFPLAKR